MDESRSRDDFSASRDLHAVVSSLPLEEGQRLILERGDRLDKERFVEGVAQHSRRGNRPNDDDSVFVSILKITHGNF